MTKGSPVDPRGLVVNVGGTSRSGSTLLHLILAGAPGAAACGEAVNWFRPVKPHHRSLDCSCGADTCARWSWLGEVDEGEFYPRAMEALEVEVLVDSSKDPSWIVDGRRRQTRDRLGRALVLAWKDPIDLAYSFWKRTGDPHYWRDQFITYYRRVLALRLPSAAVNFRDLMSDPAAILEPLCASVGLTYREGMERFWEREQHYLFGSLSVRRQVEAGSSRLVPRTSFPPEFERLIPMLEAQVRADTTVTSLVSELQARDPREQAPKAAVGSGHQLRHPLPPWYYVRRAKRAWYRRFPKPSGLEESERAAEDTLRVTREGDQGEDTAA